MTTPSEAKLLPTPGEMIAHLDRFIHGQARAKQDLAVAAYNHYLSQAYRDREGVDLGRHHILLIGPTGVGKTYLVRTLAQYLDVPIGFTSAAGLVEAGYKGNSVDTVIRSLLDRAGGNPRKAEKGIIFIDEIDKVRRSNSGARDVSGEGVQNALLTLLDGRQSRGMEGQQHAAIDTGRLLFVCTGAFVDLQSIITKRLGKNKPKIGFRARPAEHVDGLLDQGGYKTLCQVETEDLVDFGMIPEFIGRFATLSVLHELSREDLRQIASSEVDRSPLQQQQRLAELHGIELTFSDDALDTVTAEAARLRTGARGLHRLIGRAVDAVDARWSELAADGVTQVIISGDCAMGKEPAELVRGEPKLPRLDEELRQDALSKLPPPPRPVMEEDRKTKDDGITDASDWDVERIRERIAQIKCDHLDWQDTAKSPKKWWNKLEEENVNRPRLLLRIAEELKKRDATITEFFLAYVYSDVDNIQANLHYLDYSRLKKEEDKRKRKEGKS